MLNRNPHGYQIQKDRVTGKVLSEGDTQQCPHCSGHFNIVPGSGTLRSFCFPCGRVTCGKPGCLDHIPYRARLDHAEGLVTKFTPLILEKGF